MLTPPSCQERSCSQWSCGWTNKPPPHSAPGIKFRICFATQSFHPFFYNSVINLDVKCQTSFLQRCEPPTGLIMSMVTLTIGVLKNCEHGNNRCKFLESLLNKSYCFISYLNTLTSKTQNLIVCRLSSRRKLEKKEFGIWNLEVGQSVRSARHNDMSSWS